MNILIIVLSLVFLITLHELGHFFFAKKFGVKVEEFGIGIPPRIYGKKIGETIYSINLLPLGGFVKMLGEDERKDDEGSFSKKPIWQRAIILVAGVVSFWLIAIFIFAFIAFNWGVMTDISDNLEVSSSYVVVGWSDFDSDISEDIRINDWIMEVGDEKVNKVSQVENYIKEGGREVKVLREAEKILVNLEAYEEGDILSALELERIAFQKPGPIGAVAFGVRHTYKVTYIQIRGISTMILMLVKGQELPEEMEIGGPVMIGSLASEALDTGVKNYLMFVGLIATILAFMNILPIPALDGGRLLFLAIEKIKGSPISAKIEQSLITIFFLLLISFMVLITIRDIYNLF